MAKSLKRAVILDRDGTIIVEKNYLKHLKDIQLIKSSVDALKKLERAGFLLIVTTNQSGVARGYLTEKKLKAINDRIIKIFLKKGVKISAIYYCPHPVGGGCGCRKPQTGMIEVARKHFGFDVKKSFCIGDKLTDIEFGHNAGMKSVLVLTGHGAEELKELRDIQRGKRKRFSDGMILKKTTIPDYVAKDISYATEWILSNAGTKK